VINRNYTFSSMDHSPSFKNNILQNNKDNTHAECINDNIKQNMYSPQLNEHNNLEPA